MAEQRAALSWLYNHPRSPARWLALGIFVARDDCLRWAWWSVCPLFILSVWFEFPGRLYAL